MDEKKLISLIELNPVLYNVHEFATNPYHKDSVWNEIGQQLGTTGEMCKKTWIKIRGRYLRTRANRKSANSQPNENTKKWRYEIEMDFYEKYLSNKRVSQPEQPENSDSPSSSKNQPNHTNRNDCQRISIDDDTEEEDFDGSSVDEDEWMASKEDDALKAFFDAMLETVNGFSDRSQHNAKAKIFSIVSELEQRELDLKALMKA